MKASLQSDAKLSGYIFLDRILKLLQDAQWHTIDEIKNRDSLPSDTLNELLNFLQQQELIDKKDEKLRITSTGLKFLQL